MKPVFMRGLAFAAALVLAISCSLAFHGGAKADGKPSIELRVDKATPQEVNDTVQQALVRDYSAAWRALAAALGNNNAAALNDNFVGFAQDQLTRRVKEQQKAGLRTRIVDRGHKVDVIFYSTEGASVELSDTATLETQILEGDTVIHSDRAQVHCYAIMTGAEDRWKVRVLETAAGD